MIDPMSLLTLLALPLAAYCIAAVILVLIDSSETIKEFGLSLSSPRIQDGHS